MFVFAPPIPLFPGRAYAGTQSTANVGAVALVALAMLAGTGVLSPAVRAQPNAPSPIAASPESYRDLGRLPLRYFEPAEHGLARQNWDVTQDANGVIYVANLNGVLVYDGVTWTPIEAADGIVRSIGYGFDDKVYVGANSAPGYLQADAQGALAFVSLSEHLPAAYRAHSLIYDTVPTDHGVYFATYEGWVFRWDGEQMHVFDPESPSSADGYSDLTAIDGEVYASLDQQTLVRLQPDGSHVPLYDLEGNFRVVVADGPAHVLVPTQRNGLWRCPRTPPAETAAAAQTNVPMPLAAATACDRIETDLEALLLSGAVYTAYRLLDGTLAIGFDEQGLALFDTEGRLLRFFDEAHGLENTEVMRLFQDRDGALWAALYGGIARIDTASPVTRFGRAEGLLSLTPTIAEHGGNLYAGSMIGVHLLDATHQPTRFERVTQQGVHINCWGLASTQEALLALCGRDVLAVRGRRSELLWQAPETVYALAVDPARPTRLFVGGYGGLYVVEPDGTGAYRTTAQYDTGNPNSVEAVRSAEGDRTTVWTGYRDEGFYRLAFLDGAPPSAATVTPVAFMDSTADIHHAIWLDGALRLTGPAPQRAVDHPTSPHFAPDSSTRDWAGDIAAARFLGDDPTGRRWFTAPNNAVYVTRAHRGDPAPAVQVLPESPGASPTRLLFDANGTGWLASETGVVRLAADLQPRGRPKALLRRVSTIEGDSMLVGTSAPATPLVVPYKHGGVRFSFASPVFEYADLVTYRVRLDGLSERWSDWEAETYRDFVNLSEGTYTFRVQARDALGRTSDETLLTFSVLPPWYRTWWAFVLWMSVGIAVVIGIAWGYGRYRGQQLALRNASLERAVAQRTSEIVRQKQEVEHQRAETERQRAALQQANGELHRLNHRLEGRTVELREALEQNKEFLGVAAHDLKNPLGGIAGIAEVLLDGEADLSPNEQRESLSMIHASALRGVELITNLLDDGHALSAGPVLHKRLEDVVKLTHAVVRWNVPQAEAKRIAIRVETPTHLWADLDASAIQRAFDNYLSNAVKYSPPGSSIEVRLRPTDDAWAHFEVRDDGPGLTSDDQAVAFGKLQRLSARPTGGEHSTGLGLYIVKQLVEAHGGEVGVDSVPGDGATFWLRVPLTPQETGVTAAASEGEVPA